MGPKTIIFNHGDKALNVSSFNLSRKNKQFKKEYQNRMKNDRFMSIRGGGGGVTQKNPTPTLGKVRLG